LLLRPISVGTKGLLIREILLYLNPFVADEPIILIQEEADASTTESVTWA